MSAEPLELRTHTSLWRIEKRLYKLYDFTLPIPVSVRQLGTAAGVGIPWFLLIHTLGIPFAPPFGHLIWIAPPVLVAWWANKPVAEGKRLGELLTSQIKFVFQPKAFARMRPFRRDKVIAVRADIWLSPTTQPIEDPVPDLAAVSAPPVPESTSPPGALGQTA